MGMGERPVPLVIIMQGLPASGKTTWVKQFMARNSGHYKRVSKDDLRAMIDLGEYSPDNEALIRRCRNQIITECVIGGYNVIVDDTNLNPTHIEAIRKIVGADRKWRTPSAEVTIRSMDTPLEECIARDAARANPVGEDAIRRMFKQYIQETEDEH